MTTASEFEQRMWEIVETIAPSRKIEFEWKTAKEAKLHKARLTQVQKQLRLLKSEIIQVKHEINTAYASQSVAVGKSFGAGLAAGLFGKRRVGGVNQLQRQQLRQAQLNRIAPYDEVVHRIEVVLNQFDQLKLQLDDWIVKYPHGQQE